MRIFQDLTRKITPRRKGDFRVTEVGGRGEIEEGKRGVETGEEDRSQCHPEEKSVSRAPLDVSFLVS